MYQPTNMLHFYRLKFVAEEARLKQLHLQQQQQQLVVSSSAPATTTWTPIQTTPPSLVEIQMEEKYIADIEMVRH